MKLNYFLLLLSVILFDKSISKIRGNFRYAYYVTLVAGGLKVLPDFPDNCGLGGVRPCQIATTTHYYIGSTIPPGDYHITLQTKP